MLKKIKNFKNSFRKLPKRLLKFFKDIIQSVIYILSKLTSNEITGAQLNDLLKKILTSGILQFKDKTLQRFLLGNLSNKKYTISK